MYMHIYVYIYIYIYIYIIHIYIYKYIPFLTFSGGIEIEHFLPVCLSFCLCLCRALFLSFSLFLLPSFVLEEVGKLSDAFAKLNSELSLVKVVNSFL